MPTLDEILSNKEQYGDNLDITIGDTQVPLGSLRSLSAKQLESVTNRMKELDGRESEIARRQKEIVDLATKAQGAYAAAQEAAAAAAKSGTAGRTDLDPFTDPWLSPVKSELEKRDKALADMKTELTTTLGMLKSAAATWAEDRWDNEYSGIDFGKREKKPTRDELLSYATQNKINDRRGMPSIRGAWDQMTAGDRLAEAQEKARQEGIEQGRREAMVSRIPPPGVPGVGAGAPPQNPKGDKSDLGDLYSQAVQDPELRALLEQLPAGLAS